MILIVLIALLTVLPLSQDGKEGWPELLEREIARIDADTPGDMGVYVKKLSDGSRLSYQADRKWYLASTVKVPIAVAVLQKHDAGALSLKKQLTLKRSDFVDGSGPMNWKEPGARVSIRYLLENMLKQSDSTAADMLLRQVGEAELNRRLKTWVADSGFGPITTLLQVRRDAYGEAHPRARVLSNMQYIELKKFKEPHERLAALAAMIGVPPKSLLVGSLEEAFERYYSRGLNSGTLEAFGQMLEKIEKGELLSASSTRLLLEHMEKMTTGEKRIKAGLPIGTRFAQKTGTQMRRMCNAGIASAPAGETYVIAACFEKFDDALEAEEGMRRLGQALARLWR